VRIPIIIAEPRDLIIVVVDLRVKESSLAITIYLSGGAPLSPSAHARGMEAKEPIASMSHLQ
jgi:hypothetical protein